MELKFSIARHPVRITPTLHLDELRRGAAGFLKYPKVATSKEPQVALPESGRRTGSVVGGFNETRELRAGIAAMEARRLQKNAEEREIMSRTPVELLLVQILGPTDFIAEAYGVTFAVSNYNTTGLVDNAKIVLSLP